MELELKIKFANKKELVEVAQALSGLTASVHAEAQEDEFEEVESPFKAQSLVQEEAEDVPPVIKTPSAKELKAQKEAERQAEKKRKEDEKAAKAKEEEEKKRLAQLAIEEEKKRILANAPAQNTAPANDENVGEQIKKIADKLMEVEGLSNEQKQAVVYNCIRMVNGPEGVPPSTYPYELALKFKQVFEHEVNALLFSKPMQGLGNGLV